MEPVDPIRNVPATPIVAVQPKFLGRSTDSSPEHHSAADHYEFHDGEEEVTGEVVLEEPAETEDHLDISA